MALLPINKIPRHKKQLSGRDLDAIIDRINVLSKMTGVGGTQVHASSMGIQVQGGGGSGIAAPMKIYEVQSSATGDDVYNCFEHLVDSTDWTSTGEVDKLVEKNTTSVEVYNLFNNYMRASGDEHLAAGDRIAAWETKDDEAITRLVGIPLLTGRMRLAITTEAAPAGDEIAANLLNFDGSEISSGLGSGISVVCYIMGGSDLKYALPRLSNDAIIPIMNTNGTWVCTSIFDAGRRAAFVDGTPGAAPNFEAFLDVDTTGDAITVSCTIAGGSALNSAIPRITDGQRVMVTNVDGTWYADTVFQASEDCACS